MKTIIKITGIIFLFIFSLSLAAQEIVVPDQGNVHEADSGKVYDSSEPYPSFPGGQRERMVFLTNNIVYPEAEKKARVQGTVFVNFIVEKDGSITHIKVLKSVSKGIDKEVIRVIKKMPKWEPGKQNGVPVRVRTNMPIKFLLPPPGTEEFDRITPSNDDAKTDAGAVDKPTHEDGIFVTVEVMPTFPGGHDARLNYLKTHIKYPALAKNNGIEGVVYVKFVVEKEGSITNAVVIHGIGGGCDEEALRAVRNMPKWNPGTQRGVPVRVMYNMPIRFSLAKDSSQTDQVFEGIESDDMEEEKPPTNSKKDEVFIFVEVMPSFPGGEEARFKYLKENIQYPKKAKEKGIQGTVYLKFIVEKDGSVTNAEVVRGIGGGCDEEALRVVRNMPKWSPATQRGKRVRVYFTMPIKYTLSKSNRKAKKKSKKKK